MLPSVRTPSTSSTNNSILAQRWLKVGPKLIAGLRMSGDLRLGCHLLGGEKSDEIGDIDEPGRPSRGIDHGQLADLEAAQNLDGIGDSTAQGNSDGIAGHDLGDRAVQGGVAALLEQAGQIAVGE